MMMTKRRITKRKVNNKDTITATTIVTEKEWKGNRNNTRKWTNERLKATKYRIGGLGDGQG